MMDYEPKIGDEIVIDRPSLYGGWWTGRIVELHNPPAWTRQNTITGESHHMVLALVEVTATGVIPLLRMVAGYHPGVRLFSVPPHWVWISGLPAE